MERQVSNETDDSQIAPTRNPGDNEEKSKLAISEEMLHKSKISESQLLMLRKIFDKYDHDGSGGINATELGGLFEALGVKLAPNDIQRILRQVDSDGSGLVSFDEFLKFLSLRVIDSVRDASFIDTKLTVASLLFGIGSVYEKKLFTLTVKGWTLWIMWYAGLVLGIISQQSLVISWNPWRKILNACAIFMIPLPCCSFGVLSVDLIWELLYQGEMWTLLALQLSWLYAIIRMLWDERCLFWACLMPSMFVSAVSDAYPAKFRTLFQKRFFIGLCVPMAWWCFIVTFGWNSPVYDTLWEFQDMSGSTLTSSVTSVGTAMLFAVRNLYGAFLCPDVFVIIVSATKTIQVHIKDLRIAEQDSELESPKCSSEKQNDDLSTRLEQQELPLSVKAEELPCELIELLPAEIGIKLQSPGELEVLRLRSQNCEIQELNRGLADELFRLRSELIELKMSSEIVKRGSRAVQPGDQAMGRFCL